MLHLLRCVVMMYIKCLHSLYTSRKRMPRRKRFGRRVCRSKSAPPDLSKKWNKRKMWTNEQMLAAIKAVQEGQPVNQAACEHGIPKTTLKDRISGRVTHGSNPGPKPYLSAVEENELTDFLKTCAQLGYGKTRRDTMSIAESVSTSVTDHFLSISPEVPLVHMNAEPGTGGGDALQLEGGGVVNLSSSDALQSKGGTGVVNLSSSDALQSKGGTGVVNLSSSDALQSKGGTSVVNLSSSDALQSKGGTGVVNLSSSDALQSKGGTGVVNLSSSDALQSKGGTGVVNLSSSDALQSKGGTGVVNTFCKYCLELFVNSCCLVLF